MGSRFVVLGLVAILLMPVSSFAENAENFIEVKGKSSLVVKPDIAHYFLKITGQGEDYKTSNKKAKDKISEMRKTLKSVMGEAPEISVLKVKNSPKGKSFEDMYQKDFITGMAKAIKGEELPEAKSPEKKEMITTIIVYFVLTKFSEENMLQMMNSLAEKDIAFDKEGLFGLPYDFDLNRSTIFYGLINSDKYLETLATDAYKKARLKAKIIAEAANKKLGKLVKIAGCGGELKGSVASSDKSNLTGKDLGPLSADPSRLVISFSKDFEFRIE